MMSAEGQGRRIGGVEFANLLVSIGSTLSSLVLFGISMDPVRHHLACCSFPPLSTTDESPVDQHVISPPFPPLFQKNNQEIRAMPHEGSYDYALSHLTSLKRLAIDWAMTGPRLLDSISMAPLEDCSFIGIPTSTTGTALANRFTDGVSFLKMQRLRLEGMPRRGGWNASDRRALRRACLESVSPPFVLHTLTLRRSLLTMHRFFHTHTAGLSGSSSSKLVDSTFFFSPFPSFACCQVPLAILLFRGHP
jgi:hypothetical protein